MGLDIDLLRSWIGRTEQLHDHATPTPLRALTATLDSDDAPQLQQGTVPPLWHWLYFLPMARQSAIDTDGHPQRGGFLPPVPLPRRMWAGSRLQFHAPLRVGQALERSARIGDVRVKEGRTSPLVFVQVHHEIRGGGVLAIVEEQDIVYRAMPAPGEPAPAPTPAPAAAQWERCIHADAVLLFRYSALTFNGHRIHYDRSHAMGQRAIPAWSCTAR